MSKWIKFFTFLKHSKNNPSQLNAEFYHSFSVRYSFFFEVIFSNIFITSHKFTCLQRKIPTQRLRAFFNNFSSRIHKTRLFFRKDQTSISSKLSFIINHVNIFHSSEVNRGMSAILLMLLTQSYSNKKYIYHSNL